MALFNVKEGSQIVEQVNLSPFVVSGGSVGLGVSPSATFHVDGTGKFSGTVKAATPSASDDLATKAYVDAHAGGGSGSGTYIDTSSTPQTKDGDLTLNGAGTMESLVLSDAEINTNSGTISATTPVLIDSFTTMASRSAEYTIQLTRGSDYTVTKMMLIHNGVEVGIAEYGYVCVGSAIDYTFDASFAYAAVELTITCPDANVTAVSVKLSRVLIDA